MVADERPVPELDLVKVRHGSRASHQMAWGTFGFGVLLYCYSATMVLAFDKLNPRQVLFEPTVTLATDTAFALLGLCATALIALVAALWATAQIADVGLSLGRRMTLTVVTRLTGMASVVVGTAGALHRADGGWNIVIAPVIFFLGLVLAYIAADVAVF